MAQGELKDMASVHGRAFEIFRVVIEAVLMRGGTIVHLHRLEDEPALVRQIAELIVVPAGVIPERPLSKDEYRVAVTYNPLPSFERLTKEFGEGNVSNLFDGRMWRKHASCQGIDETPGERVFLVKHFDRETESEANIAEMGKLGYRPATHVEAYEFQKAQPDLQRLFWIAALGSFALRGGRRSCLTLSSASAGRRRVLGNRLVDYKWADADRFLFIREAG